MSKAPETLDALSRAEVERRAWDHLSMIRVHLESIRRIVTGTANEGLSEPWRRLAARQAKLDVRFVVEEMMLLSVAAHRTAGEFLSKRIRKEYKAGVIAKELAKLNPNYFPIAISVIGTDDPDVDGQFIIREGEHLTADLAVKYWSRSGDALHASSKGQSSDFLSQAETFLSLAISLLETFEVDVSGKGMWIGGHLHFGEERSPEIFYAHAVN